MPLFMISGDTNGLRACEFSLAVERAHTDGDFSRLRVDALSPQAGASERLELIHGVLGKRTTVIAAALLPFSAAESGDRIDCFVAPCGALHARLPVSSTIAWRDARFRTACRNRGMARLGLLSAVAANGIEPCVGRNLVKQLGQDITVGDVLMRHQHGAHLSSVRGERDMHFAPRATLRIAMLAHRPFAFAVDLHTRAVDHQIDRFVVAKDRQLDLKSTLPTILCRPAALRERRFDPAMGLCRHLVLRPIGTRTGSRHVSRLPATYQLLPVVYRCRGSE